MGPRDRVGAVASFLALAVALGGCSTGGSDGEPEPVAGAPKAIVAVLDRLEQAVAARDFATVCDDLLTPAARERAGGADCASALRDAASNVRQPSVQPLAVRLRGERAEVRVRSRAAGQRPIEDVLELVQTPVGWRIEALGGA